MSYGVYLALVVVLCLALVWWLKLNSLYILFTFAFVQNLVLPFMYTSLGSSRDLLLGLLLFKEILLLLLFFYCTHLWSELHRAWPKPLFVLFLFTLYCVSRVSVGLLVLHDDPYESFRKLRMVCFPLEILTVAVTVGAIRPKFATKFLKHQTYLLAFLGLIGILLFLMPSKDFWASRANIATYSIDIKGDDPFYYVEDQGVSGTGLARDVFLDLSSFRAMGTFGDPLAMSFAMTAPILLLVFVYKRTWCTPLLFLTLGIALLFTFSRSAWIFVFAGGIYILFRKRKYSWLIAFAVIPILAIVTIRPLADFAVEGWQALSWTNPGGEHAEGIVWFYKRAFIDWGNILGKGMRDEVQFIPESGYAFLLEHFGLAAYVTWLWFLLSLYRHLRLRDTGPAKLPLVSEAMVLGTFIVVHFSQYPFSFIGWLPIWYVFGLSMASAPVRVKSMRGVAAVALRQVPLLPGAASGEPATGRG
ncbi:MAG TPA: hypothetical protein VN682_19405 [Terriglobales bacterium]|nr:hypothetical protein [Terriglobales bacterium]